MLIQNKNKYYAFTFYFTCTHSCWCYTLAGEYLYTHGPEDQKHPQHRCSDRCYHLAAAGIRAFEFIEKHAYLIDQRRNISILYVYLNHKIKFWSFI